MRLFRLAVGLSLVLDWLQFEKEAFFRVQLIFAFGSLRVNIGDIYILIIQDSCLLLRAFFQV